MIKLENIIYIYKELKKTNIKSKLQSVLKMNNKYVNDFKVLLLWVNYMGAGILIGLFLKFIKCTSIFPALLFILSFAMIIVATWYMIKLNANSITGILKVITLCFESIVKNIAHGVAYFLLISIICYRFHICNEPELSIEKTTPWLGLGLLCYIIYVIKVSYSALREIDSIEATTQAPASRGIGDDSSNLIDDNVGLGGTSLDGSGAGGVDSDISNINIH